MNNSVAFRTLIILCNYHFYLVPSIFITPKGSPALIKRLSHFLLLPASVNYQSALCVCMHFLISIFHINGTLHSDLCIWLISHTLKMKKSYSLSTFSLLSLGLYWFVFFCCFPFAQRNSFNISYTTDLLVMNSLNFVFTWRYIYFAVILKDFLVGNGILGWQFNFLLHFAYFPIEFWLA